MFPLIEQLIVRYKRRKGADMYDTKTEYDDMYVNICERSKMTFQIFIGARGTGKTFSALKGELNNKFTGEKFIYLRNTEKECKISVSPIGNAFKSLNRVFGTNIEGEYTESLSFGEYWDKTDENEEEQECIGYVFGLSTFAGARSVDLSDVDRVIFEEFIPETHVRKFKDRGKAFLNFYETLARNREVEGEEPVKVYLLANAIDLRDDILQALGVVHEIEDMIARGEKRRTIPDRDVYVELVDTVSIVDKKKNTALYKMASSEFTEESLKADFHSAGLHLIKPKFNQREYHPVLSFGTICIYMHSSNETMHIARTGEIAKEHLTKSEYYALRQMLKPSYRYNIGAGKITFDSFETRKEIEAALDIKD